VVEGVEVVSSPLTYWLPFPTSQVALTQNMGNYFEFCQEKVSVSCFNNSRDTENNMLCFSVYFEANETNMYLK